MSQIIVSLTATFTNRTALKYVKYKSSDSELLCSDIFSNDDLQNFVRCQEQDEAVNHTRPYLLWVFILQAIKSSEKLVVWPCKTRLSLRDWDCIIYNKSPFWCAQVVIEIRGESMKMNNLKETTIDALLLYNRQLHEERKLLTRSGLDAYSECKPTVWGALNARLVATRYGIIWFI